MFRAVDRSQPHPDRPAVRGNRRCHRVDLGAGERKIARRAGRIVDTVEQPEAAPGHHRLHSPLNGQALDAGNLDDHLVDARIDYHRGRGPYQAAGFRLSDGKRSDIVALRDVHEPDDSIERGADEVVLAAQPLLLGHRLCGPCFGPCGGQFRFGPLNLRQNLGSPRRCLVQLLPRGPALGNQLLGPCQILLHLGQGCLLLID